ncbi:MAG TPA: type II secretion system protein GspC [Rudaea sp.]|jgi:general secretion pathway protein C|uniref:type II secretion system protein GspC n=1 Tax=Rudaea sp. TaxID=2136325 RepID=UPI002F939DE2
MLNPLSAADTERTSKFAARAACALAGLLCIWLLVRVIWLFVPRAGDSALAPAVPNVAPATAAASVAQWHLFGNPQTVDLAARALNAPKTALKLVLRGTLAMSDAKAGIAIIADEQNVEHSYNVGDAVAGSAKLTEVYTDHVVLSHDGVAESLQLPRPDEYAAPSADRATVRAPGTAASVPPGYAPNAGANSAAVRAGNPGALARMNAADLARQVQFEPVFDGGKITGAHLSGSGAAAALMNQIGLKPTDMVTAVNGTPLSSVSNPQQLLDQLGNASSLQITVQRDGRPATLTLNLR